MGRLLIIVVTLAAAVACADRESRRLENDNPIRPIPPPPYQMEEGH